MSFNRTSCSRRNVQVFGPVCLSGDSEIYSFMMTKQTTSFVTDILARTVCSEFTQAILVTDILLARIVCSESTQAVLVTDIVAT